VKLNLPDVTLVVVDTKSHQLTRVAVDKCLKVANFGDIHIHTNQSEHFKDLNHKHEINRIPVFKDKYAVGIYLWAMVPSIIQTSHFLFIQWDSWIINPAAWTPEFLNFDYIGAPWWYDDGYNVGNGGFSLRSTRMTQFVADNYCLYPHPFARNEDDLLCRAYRGSLEHKGFKWAPAALAFRFAFERLIPENKPFGFHGIFNWHRVLTPDELSRHLGIAKDNEYIKQSGMLDELQVA